MIHDHLHGTEPAERMAAGVFAVLAAMALLWYSGAAIQRGWFVVLGVVLIGPLVALADPVVQKGLERSLNPDWRGATGLWTAFMAVVVFAAFPTGSISVPLALRWGTFLALPLAIATLSRRELNGVHLLLTALAIGAPVLAGFVPPLWLLLRDREPLDLTYPILADFCLVVALGYRPVSDIGYRLWLPGREVRRAAIGFLGYGILALPLGWKIGFLTPELSVKSPIEAAGLAMANYFLVALPEELLFRGMLQNALQQLLGLRLGLVLGAVAFGLAHLKNPPAPNWRYALLAALAGLAYGHVYQRTRSIAASAITHTLVDWSWVVFFGGLRPVR